MRLVRDGERWRESETDVRNYGETVRYGERL